MYYSEKVREQKVKELENNEEFMNYARKQHEECKRVGAMGGGKTFEKYLLSEVFTLYDNFTLLEFMQKADRKTINRALDMAFEEFEKEDSVDNLINSATQRSKEEKVDNGKSDIEFVKE
jgi:hypothetical protein